MNAYNLPHRQGGAVLVVSLVLMTVLTLIGVASMTSSSLELKAASNSQQLHTAFEGGLSRIEFAASNNDNNPINYLIAIQNVDLPATWPVQTCNVADGCADGTNWNATAQVVFTGGCREMPGFSLESGRAPVMRTFEIDVAAQNSTGTSTSNQVQGVRYPAAGC